MYLLVGNKIDYGGINRSLSLKKNAFQDKVGDSREREYHSECSLDICIHILS